MVQQYHKKSEKSSEGVALRTRYVKRVSYVPLLFFVWLLKESLPEISLLAEEEFYIVVVDLFQD
jgi:hypothetical protein